MSTLTKPVPVRLTDETSALLKEMEEYTALGKGALLRLAIKVGLPEIKKRFGNVPASTTRKTPAKSAR